jgi:magnesium-transporting ATPase (P-type)
MATLNGIQNSQIIIKGAPEVIMKRCVEHLGGYALEDKQIISQIERLGSKGMRVLAVAQKDWSKNYSKELSTNDVLDGFQFVGLIGMIDPPRAEAIEAIKACHNAGIVVNSPLNWDRLRVIS